MVHYAVTIDGSVIGSRSSKSHAVQIYTHAVIVDGPAVRSYHSSEQLAVQARAAIQARIANYPDHWERPTGLRVVPVAVTARRAKVGDVVVAQGVL